MAVRSVRPTYPEPFDPKSFSFEVRLRGSGMFFQRTDPVHRAARRLVRRLERLHVPYAIAGAMAVNAHGARRTTDDVDVLLSRRGFEQFKRLIVAKWYAAVPGPPRRFVEKQR